VRPCPHSITEETTMTDIDLNTLMEIDHVVRVRDDGTVTDQGTTGVYAPEVHIEYDGPFAEAQISDDQERAMIDWIKGQGWDVLTGWALGGGLALMHASQYIGGRLADHIRKTPGYWVVCSVELHPGEDDPEHESNGGNGESEAAGWILCHRETGL
jgi:hypothetical protein